MAGTITTLSPITLKPLCTHEDLYTSPDGPQQAVSRAQAAFKSYKTTTLKERQQIIRKFLEKLLEKKDELGQEITEQMGRPIRYTAKEVETAVKRAEYMLKISDDVLKDRTVDDVPEGQKMFVRKEPVGVIFVVFAWNYPWLILVNSLIPALLAGNSLLLKPSPQTPLVANRAVELLLEAGLPKDVVQAVHIGDPANIQSMSKQPGIASVVFTGSVSGGLALQEAATKSTIPVTLELGGKDPAYVRSDVDIAAVAEDIVDGSVFNSGQSCCAIERVYVHETIYDEFVKALGKVLEGYNLGDPRKPETLLGPVTSVDSAKRIKSHVDDAVKKGAKQLTPDVFGTGTALGENYVRPELLVDCKHNMLVMKDETFGPLIPVQKVSSDEEAIALMNDSNFGLTASIWTKDSAKGLELLADVEAGTVFLNRSDYPAPELTWTGWKESGKGSTMGYEGWGAVTKNRAWNIKGL